MNTLDSGDFVPVVLRAPDRSSAEVTLHGANVTSWRTPDGRERLYLSERSGFNPTAAIRGGVPVVFPQFAAMGPLAHHGFARTSLWQLLDTQNTPEEAVAHFRLTDSGETRALWPYAFQLDLTVTVGGPRLAVVLDVTNTGTEPFTFTTALHTYFRVSEIGNVSVEGLEGMSYRDHGVEGQQPMTTLRIEGQVDRLYKAVPSTVYLHDADAELQIVSEGFQDAVVWNPGPELSAALPDLGPDAYHDFLCIEAAQIYVPVELAPGGVWRGAQTITALS
ncbi:MAG TPA: D-hexose-6-phosphate mutarotase [Aggregatilinea sp.]|uniref:D-hexose-6-phosphate mutarotase n=1 Tax=Aggregatilinea sp. TaxID=2806333 RepID=UPI002C0F113D|nr:D-hexose-6-phosphate mutarotase [Aggregatilinea sp.]HML20544.1 D-hexose-6-phosphate mutarotase [Aggregatilinea sp.]